MAEDANTFTVTVNDASQTIYVTEPSEAEADKAASAPAQLPKKGGTTDVPVNP